jgi:hypothetical protein
MQHIILERGDAAPDAARNPATPAAGRAGPLAAVAAQGLMPDAGEMAEARRAMRTLTSRPDVSFHESAVLCAWVELLAEALDDGDAFGAASAVRRMRAVVRAGKERRVEIDAADAR